MSRQVRALLIQNDNYARESLRKTIGMHFPAVSLDVAGTKKEAADLLRGHNYDIIVCDLFHNGVDSISNLYEICLFDPKKYREIIVITGNSDLTRSSLPSSVSNAAISCILHKPIKVADLAINFEQALKRIQNYPTRKRDRS